LSKLWARVSPPKLGGVAARSADGVVPKPSRFGMRFAIPRPMNRRLIHNTKSKNEHRRELRHKLTSAEAVLWLSLKNSQLGAKFRRQHSIGPYIADFF